MGSHTLVEFEDLLRSPVNTLVFAARRIVRLVDREELDKARELLPIVKQNADALERLVEELLERAVIREETLLLELGPDDLQALRASCASRLQPPPESVLEEDMSGPLVLVADDDRSCRLLVAAVLRQSGYRVAEAENGREALQIIDSCRPQLLILDGLMPEIDGLEVCKRSKELDPSYNPKTVIVTAVYKAPRHRHRALAEIGVDEYLTKPLQIDDLVACLQRLADSDEDD